MYNIPRPYTGIHHSPHSHQRHHTPVATNSTFDYEHERRVTHVDRDIEPDHDAARVERLHAHVCAPRGCNCTSPNSLRVVQPMPAFLSCQHKSIRRMRCHAVLYMRCKGRAGGRGSGVQTSTSRRLSNREGTFASSHKSNQATEASAGPMSVPRLQRTSASKAAMPGSTGSARSSL